jgi:hypothetical protein
MMWGDSFLVTQWKNSVIKNLNFDLAITLLSIYKKDLISSKSCLYSDAHCSTVDNTQIMIKLSGHQLMNEERKCTAYFQSPEPKR